MKFKYRSQIIIVCLLFFVSSRLLASTEQNELWLDLSINKDVPHFKDWTYLLEVQTRFVDEANHYEFSFFQTGLGYRTSDTLSFWGGYQWVGKNVITDRPRENHIWEQIVWQPYSNHTFTFRTRTLFEQIRQMHEPQWASYFREKLSLYFPEKFFFNWTPLIYDEIFIKLNNPDWWSDTKTFEQNRFFIGLDIPVTKTTFFEIGYIQQNIFSNTEDQLNHILYVGFNINSDSLPFAEYVR